MPSSPATQPRPPFSSPPLDPSGPPGNAWDLYGISDSLEALNLLTPVSVAAAAAEIKTEIFERAWRNGYREALPQRTHRTFYTNGQQEVEDWDSITFREASVLLSSFSLVKIDETGHRISMHPLVHVWARDRLSEELQGQYWTAASSALAASISWEYKLTDFRFRRILMPHIEACISFCRDEPFISRDSELGRVEMAEKFALVYNENGRFQDGVELLEKALETSQRTLDSGDIRILSTMIDLSLHYQDVGRLQEATKFGEQVVELSKRFLGNEHPDTFIVKGNLAGFYHDLGRIQEAMELSKEVKEAVQRTRGSEHPYTLTMMNNLAIHYGAVGRYQEALELANAVVEASQRTLGNEHPHTLRALLSLAHHYSLLGYKQKAIELSENVVKGMQKTRGNEHPDSLKAMDDLAHYKTLDCRPMVEVNETSEKLTHTTQEQHLDHPSRENQALVEWMRRNKHYSHQAALYEIQYLL